MGDLTKNDIEVCDLEINDDGDGISAYLETLFDVDEKFGTNVNDDDDSWVNFYAEYFPESGELKCTYVIDKPQNNEEYEYIPSKAEKDLIVSMMEELCQKEEGSSLADLLNNFQEDKTIEMGGIT